MSSFADIAEKKRALDAARPLPAAIVRRLAEWFEQELTVGALLVEKAGLSRDEILQVMERGKPLRSLPAGAQTLIFNHRRALELMARLSYPQEGGTSERTVLAFHSVIFQTVDEQAGRYRDTMPEPAAGAPDPAKLRISMSAVSQWLKRADNAPETAIEAHARLMQLRPFAQGNAAVALLISNLMLNRAGYPPVVLSPKVIPAYEAALARIWEHDDRTPLRQLFIDLLDDSIDVCLVGATHGANDDHCAELEAIPA